MAGAGALQFVLAFFEIGMAIAIIVLVANPLWAQIPYALGTCYQNWWGATWCTGEYVCLMTTSSVNICSYSWWLAGFGILLSVFVCIAQCISSRGRSCAAGAALAALVGTIWWLGGAITLMINGKNADSDGYQYDPSLERLGMDTFASTKDQRTAVWAMAWAEFSLFTIATLLALADCVKARKDPKPQQPAYPAGAYVAPGGYPAGPPPPQYYPPPGAAPPPGYPQAPPQAYPPPGAVPPPPMA